MNWTNSSGCRVDWIPEVLAASSVNCTSTTSGGGDLEYGIRLIHGVVIPILAGVGIVLNLLNLVVLSNGKLQESSYTYLTGLACADAAMLALFCVNGVGRGNFPNDGDWRRFEAFVYFPVGFMATTAGSLLTVTVSVERYVFIYQPIWARTWCTRRVARAITATIWTACVAANVPRFFVFDVDEQLGKLEYTEFGRSRPYKYMSWFHLIVVSSGCGLALVVLNALLIRGLRRHSSRRRLALGARCSAHQRADDHRLTRTLISIVFIYLMGEIPSALTSRALVVGLSGDPCTAETRAFRILSLISTILIVLQLSLNFVVYCVMNRRFWAVFTDQLCRCCTRRRTADVRTSHVLLNNNQPRDATSTHYHEDKRNEDNPQENGQLD